MTKILFLFVFSLSGTAHGFESLSNLITDARALALDSSSNPSQRFTDTQVTEFINQGMRLSISQNSCLQQNIVFNLSPGSTYYSLPTNYEAITRVTIGQKYIPAQSVAGLDGKSRGWEAASGYPTYYFVNFTSRSLVGFAPWPAQSTDTDTVKVEYTIAATDLVNSGDLPWNGVNELQQYNHILAYYAASLMYLVNGMEPQSKNLMDMFSVGLKTMENHCVETPSYLPSGAGVN